MRPRLFPFALAALLLGCNREAREWTPADHDHAEDPGNAAQAQAPGRAPTPAEQQAQLVELTWSQQCTTCHGANGRGDGPSGPMVRAPDLTSAELQSALTDERIARAITQGKGRMPKLDVPPPIVDGLVKRVRSLRAR